MTTDDRTERFLHGWLAAGPTDLPAHVLEDAMHEIDHLPQARSRGIWPFPGLSQTGRWLLAAGLVLAVTVTVGLLGRLVPMPDGPAQPAPSAAPSLAPSLPPLTAPVTTFDSPAFGWSLDHPSDWAVQDPMGDLVSFVGPADVWVHVYVSPAVDNVASGGFWWPWGSAWPIYGATTDDLLAAALARLRADGTTIVGVHEAALGGEPAWRIDLERVDFDERSTPARIYLLHHGWFAYAVFVYGVLPDVPPVEALLGSFRFVDPPLAASPAP